MARGNWNFQFPQSVFDCSRFLSAGPENACQCTKTNEKKKKLEKQFGTKEEGKLLSGREGNTTETTVQCEVQT